MRRPTTTGPNRLLVAGLAALLGLGCQSVALRPAAAGVATQAATAAAPVTFTADETLFTFVAWMDWVSDSDDPADDPAGVPLREALAAKLQTLSPALRARHRSAYARALPTNDPTTKNRLLLLFHRLYGPAPKFSLRLPDDSYAGPDRQLLLAARGMGLPSSAHLNEFYQAAELGDLWQRLGKPEIQRRNQHFAAPVQTMLRETNAFLKMTSRAPVAIQINLLGYYGLHGQTTYSPWDAKYLIQINPAPGADAYTEMDNRQIFRHEYTHALLNDAVMANESLIDGEMLKVAGALKTDLSATAELFAQCVEWYDSPTAYHDNVIFRNKNLLLPHFMDKIPEFQQSGLTMAEYLPTLFRTFRADTALETWKRIEAARKAKGLSK